MASLIASKTEILKESRKIKTRPRSHQIKLLTFKKKVHYTKFVDWVDSSDDAIKKVKLPKRRELLNLGGSGNLGMILALGVANFWKDIKALLEKFGFGNWKVGLATLGLGVLGLGALISKVASKLNPFKGKGKGKFNKQFNKNTKRRLQQTKKRQRITRSRTKGKWNRRTKITKGSNRLQRNISKLKSTSLTKVSRGSNWLQRNISKLKPTSSKVSSSGPSNLSKIKPNFLKKPITGIKPSGGGVLSKLKNIKVSPKSVVSGAKGLGIGLAIDWIADQTIFKAMDFGFDRLGESQMRNKVKEYGWQKVYNKQTQLLQAELAKKDKPWWITEGGIGSRGYKSQDLIEVLQKNIKYLQKLKEEKQSSLSPTINNLIKPSEKTVVVSQKTQSNDGDTTIVMAPNDQQVLPSQPAQQGGVIPFPVGGGNNSVTVASSVPESETLNNMWTNILLTKLATS